MPGKGKPFEKGNTLGKGRPSLPDDLKGVKEITSEYFKKLVSVYLDMTVQEISEIAGNPATPAKEAMVAQVILSVLEDGDHSRFEFLLNRTIGRVTDKMEIRLPVPTIIKKLDGGEVILGAKLEEEEK